MIIMIIRPKLLNHILISRGSKDRGGNNKYKKEKANNYEKEEIDYYRLILSMLYL